MFVRVKKSGKYQYLQVVQNERVEGKVRQHVVASLGRLDVLKQTGQLDALVNSRARFLDHSLVLSAHRQGKIEPVSTKRIGPELVFGRWWRDLGMPKLFEKLLEGRNFAFDVERAIFLTVLHRLFSPGSHPAAGQATWPPSSGEDARSSTGSKTCNCTISTEPWPGSANRSPRMAKPMPHR